MSEKQYVNFKIHVSFDEIQQMVRTLINTGFKTNMTLKGKDHVSLKIEDSSNECISFAFDRKDDKYSYEGNLTIKSEQLQHALKRIIRTYRVTTDIHMTQDEAKKVYQHINGYLETIQDVTDQKQETIFSQDNALQPLPVLIYDMTVEEQIHQLKEEIDGLLDQRFQTTDGEQLVQIDASLKEKTTTLHTLTR